MYLVDQVLRILKSINYNRYHEEQARYLNELNGILMHSVYQHSSIEVQQLVYEFFKEEVACMHETQLFWNCIISAMRTQSLKNDGQDGEEQSDREEEVKHENTSHHVAGQERTVFNDHMG